MTLLMKLIIMHLEVKSDFFSISLLHPPKTVSMMNIDVCT